MFDGLKVLPADALELEQRVRAINAESKARKARDKKKRIDAKVIAAFEAAATCSEPFFVPAGRVSMAAARAKLETILAKINSRGITPFSDDTPHDDSYVCAAVHKFRKLCDPSRKRLVQKHFAELDVLAAAIDERMQHNTFVIRATCTSQLALNALCAALIEWRNGASSRANRFVPDRLPWLTAAQAARLGPKIRELTEQRADLRHGDIYTVHANDELGDRKEIAFVTEPPDELVAAVAVAAHAAIHDRRK